MKTQDVYPTRFVRAEDIEHQMPVIIDRVVMEAMYDERARKELPKPVVYFKNATKGMVLGPDNWRTIDKTYGDESDNWVGKAVVLDTKEYKINGEVVRGIIVKIPITVPAKK